MTLDLPVLLSLDGQCQPVMLVELSLDQLSESLQFIVTEAVPTGFTGCSEHSIKN